MPYPLPTLSKRKILCHYQSNAINFSGRALVKFQYNMKREKKKLFEFTISFRGDGDGAWEALLSWCVPRWVCQLITECCSVPCRVVCSVYFYSFTGHWRVPLEDVDPPRRYYLGFGMQRIQMPPGYDGVYRATDTPICPDPLAHSGSGHGNSWVSQVIKLL